MNLTHAYDIALLARAGWKFRPSEPKGGYVDPVTGDLCNGVEAVRRQMARNDQLLQPQGCYGFSDGYKGVRHGQRI